MLSDRERQQARLLALRAALAAAATVLSLALTLLVSGHLSMPWQIAHWLLAAAAGLTGLHCVLECALFGDMARNGDLARIDRWLGLLPRFKSGRPFAARLPGTQRIITRCLWLNLANAGLSTGVLLCGA